MRLSALVMMQSVLLSLHQNDFTLIDSKQVLLDTTYVLTTEARFAPLAMALLVADAYTAPLSLLVAQPLEANSTIVQSMTIDIVPQLARHEVPDLQLAIAFMLCLEALKTESKASIAAISIAAMLLSHASTRPEHDNLAIFVGWVGLNRYDAKAFAIAICLGTVLEFDRISKYFAHLCTLVLFATDPIHAKALRMMPDTIKLTESWPTFLRNPLIEAVGQFIQHADEIGGSLLSRYVDLLKNTHM